MSRDPQNDMERMAALGNLARGLAHEMNTPLSAIACNNDTIETALRRIREHLDKPPERPQSKDELFFAEMINLLDVAQDSLRTSRVASDRLRAFIRSLRDFSRIGNEALEKTDIREPIETALLLLAHELRGRITVAKEFGDIAPMDVHKTQLSQVFMNILMNSAQAIEGKGEIRIQTRQEGNTARISISDNGPGISPEVQARIFEPGFTTKNADTGTGLGLAICLKIVEAHHGRIEMQSQAGKGSTFTIILPIAADPVNTERTTNG